MAFKSSSHLLSYRVAKLEVTTTNGLQNDKRCLKNALTCRDKSSNTTSRHWDCFGANKLSNLVATKAFMHSNKKIKGSKNPKKGVRQLDSTSTGSKTK